MIEAAPDWINHILTLLALPKFGLTSLFLIAFFSATLLPLGSEPALLGLVKLNPEMFWPGVLVATIGNTLGGMVTYWMGFGAHEAIGKARHTHTDTKALNWLKRFGSKACLLSWLPIVGDPLCGVAGWLKLPFWPCTVYMAIGKFLRYVTMTFFLLYAISWWPHG